jgi:hypothetical protein
MVKEQVGVQDRGFADGGPNGNGLKYLPPRHQENNEGSAAGNPKTPCKKEKEKRKMKEIRKTSDTRCGPGADMPTVVKSLV